MENPWIGTGVILICCICFLAGFIVGIWLSSEWTEEDEENKKKTAP